MLSGEERFRAPATDFQRMVWGATARDSGTTSYCMSVVFDILGNVDLPALELGLKDLYRCTPALRTGIVFGAKMLWQEVLPASTADRVVLEVHVVSDASSGQAFDKLAGDLMGRFADSLDLSQPPLWRVFLLTDGRQRHRLILLGSHGVTDGQSMSVLMEELSLAYEARRGGVAWLPASYSPTYFDWQQHRQNVMPKGAAESWWDWLDGALPLCVPENRSSNVSNSQPCDFRTLRYPVDTGQMDRIATCAQQLRITPIVLYLSALCALQTSRQGADAILATMGSGRYSPRWSRTIGPLAYPLPVRLAFDPVDPRSSTIRNAENLQYALSLPRASIEAIARQRHTPGSSEHPTLYHCLVEAQRAPRESLRLKDARVTAQPPLARHHGQLPLSISFLHSKRSASVYLETSIPDFGELDAMNLLEEYLDVLAKLTRKLSKDAV